MRASITIEAALVVPFLCLVVWAMILVTLLLYESVKDFGEMTVGELAEINRGTSAIRIERMLCQKGKE